MCEASSLLAELIPVAQPGFTSLGQTFVDIAGTFLRSDWLLVMVIGGTAERSSNIEFTVVSYREAVRE